MKLNILIKPLIFVTVLLSGCDQYPQSVSNNSDQALELIIEPPVVTTTVTQTRAYNPDNLILAVAINGQPMQTVRRDDGRNQVAGINGSSFDVQIEWFENVDGIQIQLTDYQGRVSADSAGRVVLSSSDYSSNQFDMDGDGDSNLLERINDTSPFNSNFCSSCSADIDVHIYSISPSEAPAIDGEYDDVWAKAQFKDRTGDLSFNLSSVSDEVSGDFASIYENEADVRWAAMHDGTYLYVLLLGEKSPYQTPVVGDVVGVSTDSGATPLMLSLHGFDLFDVNGNPATESSSLRDDVVANMGVCLCEGDQTLWEFRIPLDSDIHDMIVGEPFVIFLSMTDDTNGEVSSLSRPEFRWTYESSAVLR